jgi:glycosyltransferase involved in cell wall biosynthesis
VSNDLVSIICLSYNHVAYIREALDSVLTQTYAHIELIIVDDGSEDGTKGQIVKFLSEHSKIIYVDIPESVGNCRAFNLGWKEASGAYIIDLAADDVLLENRVAEGVYRLRETGAGVHFSDAWLIDHQGEILSKHNERFDRPIPEGDLYQDLVSRYLICPPTMMIKREVLEALGGYDESLEYEDFDFWVRSSREFTYAYTDEPLVKKRVLKNSHARTQDKFRNSHQRSTLAVCKKIVQLNRSKGDRRALGKRCWHEIRQCIKKGNLGLIPDYLSILKQC